MNKKIILMIILICAWFSTSAAGKKGTIAFGAKLTSPQIFSVSATTYPYHLWLVQVEPGIGGGKVNVGLGFNWQYKVGFAIKSTILRTWGSPMGGIEPNQTYVGGEVEMMWKGVNLSLGLLGHMNGDKPKRDVILSAGIGIGF